MGNIRDIWGYPAFIHSELLFEDAIKMALSKRMSIDEFMAGVLPDLISERDVLSEKSHHLYQRQNDAMMYVDEQYKTIKERLDASHLDLSANWRDIIMLITGVENTHNAFYSWAIANNQAYSSLQLHKKRVFCHLLKILLTMRYQQDPKDLSLDEFESVEAKALFDTSMKSCSAIQKAIGVDDQSLFKNFFMTDAEFKRLQEFTLLSPKASGAGYLLADEIIIQFCLIKIAAVKISLINYITDPKNIDAYFMSRQVQECAQVLFPTIDMTGGLARKAMVFSSLEVFESSIKQPIIEGLKKCLEQYHGGHRSLLKGLIASIEKASTFSSIQILRLLEACASKSELVPRKGKNESRLKTVLILLIDAIQNNSIASSLVDIGDTCSIGGNLLSQLSSAISTIADSTQQVVEATLQPVSNVIAESAQNVVQALQQPSLMVQKKLRALSKSSHSFFGPSLRLDNEGGEPPVPDSSMRRNNVAPHSFVFSQPNECDGRYLLTPSGKQRLDMEASAAQSSEGVCVYSAFGVNQNEVVMLLVNGDAALHLIMKPLLLEALSQRAFYEDLLSNAFVTCTQEESIKSVDVLVREPTVMMSLINRYAKNNAIDAGGIHPSILQAVAHFKKIELHLWSRRGDADLVPLCLGANNYGCYQPKGPGLVCRVDLLADNTLHFKQLQLNEIAEVRVSKRADDVDDVHVFVEKKVSSENLDDSDCDDGIEERLGVVPVSLMSNIKP